MPRQSLSVVYSRFVLPDCFAEIMEQREGCWRAGPPALPEIPSGEPSEKQATIYRLVNAL
jgi:hypothetical protein